MMTTAAHREIAKERFLEIMAQSPNGDASFAAVQAIEHADAFERAYLACGKPDCVPAKKLKGCKNCFGSGGKIGEPCKWCKGIGKVMA